MSVVLKSAIAGVVAEKGDEALRAVEVFQLKSIADMARSQLSFVSKDLRVLAAVDSGKRFASQESNERYKAARQALKDYRQKLQRFINTLDTAIRRKEALKFDATVQLKLIMDSYQPTLMAEYVS